MDKQQKMNQFNFEADKISGFEGSVFGASFFPECLKLHNLRHRFKYPFWGGVIEIKNHKGDEYIDESRYNEVCDEIIGYVKENGFDYFKEFEKIQREESEEFKKYCHKMMLRMPTMSDRKLVYFFNEFIYKYCWYYAWGSLTFLYEHILSERIGDSLSLRYDNAVEILSSLLKADYQSFMVESENLLKKIKLSKSTQDKEKSIRKYIDNYFFIDTNYGFSPVIDRKRVLFKIKILMKHAKKQEYGKHAAEINLTGIKLSVDEKIIINLLKVSEIVRDKRKQIAMAGVYVMFRFLDEAVKRTKFKKELADRIFWFEYADLLKTPRVVEKITKNRICGSIIFADNNIIYSDKTIISGKDESYKKVKEIKGTPAAKGFYKGSARIILTQKDFKKMKRGDILVAEMTRPDFLPIMKLAGAIITDEGGLTCHAAIISRELGIPCIVGTKIATQVLKDGDLVKVNADKGIIKKV